MSDLGLLRQYFGEQPDDKTYTAKELWRIFNIFAPLMTKEQEKELIDHLDKLINKSIT